MGAAFNTAKLNLDIVFELHIGRGFAGMQISEGADFPIGVVFFHFAGEAVDKIIVRSAGAAVQLVQPSA